MFYSLSILVLTIHYNFKKQALNFQTGLENFKPGAEKQIQIQTGSNRLKYAGENPGICGRL